MVAAVPYGAARPRFSWYQRTKLSNVDPQQRLGPESTPQPARRALRLEITSSQSKDWLISATKPAKNVDLIRSSSESYQPKNREKRNNSTESTVSPALLQVSVPQDGWLRRFFV